MRNGNSPLPRESFAWTIIKIKKMAINSCCNSASVVGGLLAIESGRSSARHHLGSIHLGKIWFCKYRIYSKAHKKCFENKSLAPIAAASFSFFLKKGKDKANSGKWLLPKTYCKVSL